MPSLEELDVLHTEGKRVLAPYAPVLEEPDIGPLGSDRGDDAFAAFPSWRFANPDSVSATGLAGFFAGLAIARDG